MAKRADTTLYALLAEGHFVPKNIIDELVEQTPRPNGSDLISELLSRQLVDEVRLLKAFADKLGLAYCSLKKISADQTVFKKVPMIHYPLRAVNSFSITSSYGLLLL